MARRFALDKSSIYINFLSVINSSVDFISFRIIVIFSIVYISLLR